MTIDYALWDVDTGNNLGLFTREEEACERVRILLDAFGETYAEDLQLGMWDREGRPISALSGSELARRAREAQAFFRGS